MSQPSPRLARISDALTAAHTKIQQDFLQLNPVVGVRSSLREAGFPADLISIDCLKSKKRIILLLHDQQPEHIGLQYGMIDDEPSTDFNNIDSDKVDEQQLYTWMKDFFIKALH